MSAAGGSPRWKLRGSLPVSRDEVVAAVTAACDRLRSVQSSVLERDHHFVKLAEQGHQLGDAQLFRVNTDGTAGDAVVARAVIGLPDKVRLKRGRIYFILSILPEPICAYRTIENTGEFFVKRSLMIPFHAGGVLQFHYIQKLRGGAAGIGCTAELHGLREFLRSAVPGGVGGGNQLADDLCRGRLIPKVNGLVPHEHEIRQYGVGSFQKPAPQFLAGAFAEGVGYQSEGDELIQRNGFRVVKDIFKIWILKPACQIKCFGVCADGQPIGLLQLRQSGL